MEFVSYLKENRLVFKRKTGQDSTPCDIPKKGAGGIRAPGTFGSKGFKSSLFPGWLSTIKLSANPEVTAAARQILHQVLMENLTICRYPANRFMVPDRTFWVVRLADKRQDHAEGHFRLSSSVFGFLH